MGCSTSGRAATSAPGRSRFPHPNEAWLPHGNQASRQCEITAYCKRPDLPGNNPVSRARRETSFTGTRDEISRLRSRHEGIPSGPTSLHTAVVAAGQREDPGRDGSQGLYGNEGSRGGKGKPGRLVCVERRDLRFGSRVPAHIHCMRCATRFHCGITPVRCQSLALPSRVFRCPRGLSRSAGRWRAGQTCREPWPASGTPFRRPGRLP